MLAVLATALFFGDAIITPSISVLSAVEGLIVVNPALEPLVLPLSIGILVALFADFVDEAGATTEKRDRTGFHDTDVRRKLYTFQRDGVLGHIGAVLRVAALGWLLTYLRLETRLKPWARSRSSATS